MHAGLIPLVSMWLYRSLNCRMNLLSDLDFMGRIKMILLLYSYNMNSYLFILLGVTGNLPVRYLAIYLFWSMIFVNTLLVRCDSGVISGSFCIIGSCFLVELMFFIVWCLWSLYVAIDGGRCLLISSIVNFVHVAKYHLLIAWMGVCLNGLNSVVWYHCARSGLVLSAISLFSALCVCVGLVCGVVARCTCHIPGTPLKFPSSTTYIFIYCRVCGSECGCTDIITYLPYVY